MKRLVLLLLLIPQLAFGAVAYDASSTGSGASVSSGSWSHTLTGSNTLLICAFGFEPTLGTVSSVTYNSVAMSSVASATTGGYQVELFRLVAPTTGTNTVAVTFTAAVRFAGGCSSFTGVDQSTPLGTAQTETGNMTAGLSITVPTNGFAMDAAVDSLNPTCTGLTPGAGQTERFDLCDGTGAILDLVGSTRSATGSFTWSNLTGGYEMQVAVPINAVAVAGSAPKRKAILFQ